MTAAELSSVLRKRLPRKKELQCTLCRLILADLKKNRKLTGHPLDYNKNPTFPVEGKLRHLALEKIEIGDVKLLTT